ncbi:L,D-transpeptidase family protein [Shimazuella soli]|uniref:L,D-transpeptidase family protein n=1 Tax=Shimazuella soli TaxID=1892854 RepID=UPI001F1011F7
MATWLTLSPNNSYAAQDEPIYYQIEINKETNKLYLYADGKVKKTYPVATGRSNDLTPEGTFPLVVKIVDPKWKDTPGGDPKNPLGPRWHGLEVNGDRGRTYGIHGTNDPDSIGKHASSGCVRMNNEDVKELYQIVNEGTPVWIHSGKSDNHWRGNASVGLQKEAGTVTIPRTKVKLWTGPNIGSFITTTKNKSTTLEKTGISGNWVQVKLGNNKYAFIQKNFLISAEKSTIIVDVDLANIRSEPNTSSTVLQKVKYGTILTYKDVQDDFYQLQLKNQTTGYISKTTVQE